MSMRSAFCSTVAVAILGLTAALGGQRAHVDVTPTQPVALSVLGLDFVDTARRADRSNGGTPARRRFCERVAA
jgi:hypothetical protein